MTPEERQAVHEDRVPDHVGRLGRPPRLVVGPLPPELTPWGVGDGAYPVTLAFLEGIRHSVARLAAQWDEKTDKRFGPGQEVFNKTSLALLGHVSVMVVLPLVVI